MYMVYSDIWAIYGGVFIGTYTLAVTESKVKRHTCIWQVSIDTVECFRGVFILYHGSLYHGASTMLNVGRPEIFQYCDKSRSHMFNFNCI